jgi:hypothetical protein
MQMELASHGTAHYVFVGHEERQAPSLIDFECKMKCGANRSRAAPKGSLNARCGVQELRERRLQI